MKGNDLHAGHRQRMLKRFRENGIESFAEHEILEMLLFLVFSRCNTNNISHMLIDKFGSINGVLSADHNELTEVDNIGDTAAAYLCFLGDFIRWLPANNVKKISLNSPEKIIEFCRPIFTNATKEMTYILTLDARHDLISQTCLNIGGANSTSVYTQNIIKSAFTSNSTNVVMVHNHIAGSPLPSVADINSTRDLYNALRAAGITLVDHIIIGPGDADKGYSMRSSEILKDIWS